MKAGTPISSATTHRTKFVLILAITAKGSVRASGRRSSRSDKTKMPVTTSAETTHHTHKAWITNSASEVR
jgi:hypothetical protein